MCQIVDTLEELGWCGSAIKLQEAIRLLSIWLWVNTFVSIYCRKYDTRASRVTVNWDPETPVHFYIKPTLLLKVERVL